MCLNSRLRMDYIHSDVMDYSHHVCPLYFPLLHSFWNIISRKLSLYCSIICGFMGTALCGSVINEEQFSLK